VVPASADPGDDSAQRAAAGLRAAIETLEAVVRDRALLGELSIEERARLFAAAGAVYNPDIDARRQWGKALRRQEKAARRALD